MSRPCKFRRICFRPRIRHFIPRGVGLRRLKEINISADELEAIRLKDYFELDQINAAKKMRISQSTFFRILKNARKKIARAIILGRAIKIKKGEIIMNQSNEREFKCEKCKHIWKEPFGTGKRGIEMQCPKCGSENVHRIDQGGQGFGRQPWGKK